MHGLCRDLLVQVQILWTEILSDAHAYTVGYLQVWVIKCCSSHLVSDTSWHPVEDKFAAVPIELPTCLQVVILLSQACRNCAITILGQKHVICHGLVNFCHVLFLCHGCSEVTPRKREWGASVLCKSKQRRFSGQSGERGTYSFNLFQVWWFVTTTFSYSATSQVCCHSSKAVLIVKISLTHK